MRFHYLQPMYGFSSEQTHVAVPDVVEGTLDQMAGGLVGSEDLIAIYIPEGTEEVYQPGNMRGRIVGGVQLRSMPHGKTIQDYYFEDWDGSRRWPIGWPCKVIYAPPIDQCPVLRSIVDQVHGPNCFQPYVSRLQNGPFELDRGVADKIEAWFSKFPRLD